MNGEIMSDDIEIVDSSEYSININDHFSNVSDIARPLIKGAKENLRKIEKALYSALTFIKTVRTAIPLETLQAVLSNE